MKKIAYRLITFLFIFSALSCGYTTKSTLSGNYRTIYISPFENKIDFTTESGRNLYLPLLEVKVKNEVVARFQFDGNLRVVTQDTADMVLKGTLLRYERSPLRYTDNNDVQEYLVRVTISMELIDRRTQTPIWSESNFSGEESYYIIGSQAKTEEAAVNEAVLDLARRIVERTIENW